LDVILAALAGAGYFPFLDLDQHPAAVLTDFAVCFLQFSAP